jgi:hypothetical protein
VKYSQGITLAKGDTYKSLTVEDIRNAVAEFSVETVPEDPLNGATVLWCHPGDEASIDAAKALLAVRKPLVLSLSPNAFAGRIYGFQGGSFLPCVVIKTKEDPDEDRIH